MSSFSETSFIKKLTELNPSQQSIQTLSLWLIHHRKHSKTIVEIWMKEIKKVKPAKKLTFLYLANDVIQNSKKKGPEFNKMFRYVMPDAYKVAIKDADEKMKGSMGRMVKIWKERGIFDEDITDKLAKAMDMKIPAATESTPSASKSGSTSTSAKPEGGNSKVAKRAVNKNKSENYKVTKKKRKVELTLREEIELEVKNGGTGQPPEASDLVKAFRDLENSASSDAAVREKIAALPPEVSDVSRLEKVTDHAAADVLTGTVDDACKILSDYNSRLANELQERRRVAKMLKEYILAQKQALTESEAKLTDYKSRLDKVATVRKELKSHMQSLPDLTLLPQVTGGLAPLPSAGDLFAIDKEAS